MFLKFKRLIYFISLTFLGVLFYLWSDSSSQDPFSVLKMEMEDIYGETVKLENFRGKIVVINFWATWCAPCIREIPLLIKLQNRKSSKDLQVLGIGIDHVAKMRKFAETNNVNYPMLNGKIRGIDMSIKLGNSVGGIPFTVILNRKGKVVKQIAGEINESTLKNIELIE